MKANKYHIRIQRYGHGMPKDIMVWPKVFLTYDDAFEFMRTCFTFNGIAENGRRLSACVERCR